MPYYFGDLKRDPNLENHPNPRNFCPVLGGAGGTWKIRWAILTCNASQGLGFWEEDGFRSIGVSGIWGLGFLDLAQDSQLRGRLLNNAPSATYSHLSKLRLGFRVRAATRDD